MSKLPEAAGDDVRRAAGAAGETGNGAAAAPENISGAVRGMAGDVSDAAKGAAGRAAGKAKDIYQCAAVKAGGTLATSKEYVRRNPVPVVFGSICFGAALGCLLMMARRRPTSGDLHADRSLAAVRASILGALAPVTRRVHDGYDSALHGAGKAMDGMNRLGSGRGGNAFSDKIKRIGGKLRFR